MATTRTFDGKKVELPGSYGEIKSGVRNPSQVTDYGRLLIIDTGLGAGFGGGAGVNGTLSKKKDAIYSFDNIEDYRNFVKGSKWWLVGEPIYRPNGFNDPGASQVDLIRACTTKPAEVVITFGGGSDSSDSGVGEGGTFTIQCRHEGVIGNGLLSGSNLYKGFGLKMINGEADDTKYMLQFWVGSWKGYDDDGDTFDNIAQAVAAPRLLVTSDEFSSFTELQTWMKESTSFGEYFKLKSSTISGDGEVDNSDLIAYSNWTVFSGGTETFSVQDLEDALDSVTELGYNFVLCNDFASTAKSANNGMILSHLLTEAKYRKYMIVGGGRDENAFNTPTGSVGIAEYYNSNRAIVVHGGCKKVSSRSSTGFKEYDSFYKAAAVAGRICGLPTQIPVTFKGIAIDGELHELTDKEKKLGLKKGVLCTHFDEEFGFYSVIQGINSIQDNSNLVNEDGTSHSIQLERIVSQVDRTLILNSKTSILKRKDGVNRFTVSDKQLRDWTINQLRDLTVTDTTDNLLLSFESVTVETSQDTKTVRYGMYPNTEITKLFFSGTILD